MRPTSLAPRAPEDLGQRAAAVALAAAGATHSAGCAAWTCIIGAALAAVTVRIMLIDLKLRLIDRRDLLAMAALGVAYMAVNSNSFPEDSLFSIARSAIFTFILVSIKIIYRFYKHVDGIGSGDIEFVAAAGFLLDVDDLAASLCLGAVFTGVFVLYRLGRRPSRRISRMRAPYGCFLAAAVLLIWVYRAMTGAHAFS